MSSYYIKLSFHRVGPLAHEEAVAEIKAIPGVTMIYDHTRQLGILHRERLLVDEWACRVLFHIDTATSEREGDRRVANERDPYRTLELGGVVHRVPMALREAITSLDADYDLVDSGWLRFSTRRYEAPILAAFEDELREQVGPDATLSLGRERGQTLGKVEGSIAMIHALAPWLRRTGLVDGESLSIGYA
ncbi:hypothetical protein G6O69_14205 [Pseudenhygromyxa sp. WMMC2535]|uniref:hypothetical protein n=1 Tax=Pseudenhygromyxa sp. WMMC2535 TaxID=2712867 RepID=UPI0015519F38|nr:hypothetical protein [Pseudenhygromyxa sp. WMMC2535]NVB38991.1 hypothetical protein [Pseudenhygromyxa sp. WMMC2535]